MMISRSSKVIALQIGVRRNKIINRRSRNYQNKIAVRIISAWFMEIAMSGRMGTEKRAMSEHIYVRMTVDLSARVHAIATRRGMSAASWVREQLIEAVGGMPIEEHELRPSPPPPPPVIPRADLAELSRVVGSVGKSVGAVVQLAAALRQADDRPGHAVAEHLLEELRHTAAMIRSVMCRVGNLKDGGEA
ncbi:MAG: hypothetical protein WCF85_18320 [Rhodospirillaceae bacterium]